MYSADQLVADLKSLGRAGNLFQNRKGKKRAQELLSVLEPDERPKGIIWGEEPGRGPGVMVATDRRLIVMAFGLVTNSFHFIPYKSITSIAYKPKSILSLPSLQIHTAGGLLQYRGAEKEIRTFGEWMQRNMFATSEGSV